VNFRPLNDRILVERVKSDEKTAGGIILPDNAQEKPLEAKVVACGAGKSLNSGKVIPLEVKKGDTICFRKYAGTEVNVSGTDYLILREDEVLAVCE